MVRVMCPVILRVSRGVGCLRLLGCRLGSNLQGFGVDRLVGGSGRGSEFVVRLRWNV